MPLSSSNLPDQQAAYHHLLHHKCHISWFQCPISSQCAQAGRAGACDSMQSRALDATAKCRSSLADKAGSALCHPAPVGQSHFIDAACFGQGKHPRDLSHPSLALVCCFGCCAIVPLEAVLQCSAGQVSQVARPSHDARRWMRKGRDGSNCPCSPMLMQLLLSLQIWKTLRPPVVQPTTLDDAANSVEILHDPLSGPRCNAGRQCCDPRSSFHSLGPLPVIGQPRLGSNIRHLPPATAKARRTSQLGFVFASRVHNVFPP
ncbi:hypothetical protein F5883DRAFT_540714 [Diaporthe sp. PMI_573]|nr:hypothetical protein F5883DRAFT_540714 [Diaporthaceae sp. PMI_573]